MTSACVWFVEQPICWSQQGCTLVSTNLGRATESALARLSSKPPIRSQHDVCLQTSTTFDSISTRFGQRWSCVGLRFDRSNIASRPLPGAKVQIRPPRKSPAHLYPGIRAVSHRDPRRMNHPGGPTTATTPSGRFAPKLPAGACCGRCPPSGCGCQEAGWAGRGRAQAPRKDERIEEAQARLGDTPCRSGGDIDFERHVGPGGASARVLSLCTSRAKSRSNARSHTPLTFSGWARAHRALLAAPWSRERGLSGDRR